MGCVELREDELTPENSSKAVNRCIVQLSTSETEDGSSVAEGAVVTGHQWGGGRTLTLELNEGSLKLMQQQGSEGGGGPGLVLNSQPIHSIRVWGVGRDNGKDFAYVARDKHTRKHLCHVFR